MRRGSGTLNNRGCYGSDILKVVVLFGRQELQLSDAEMARELCISRERVRQIRAKIGVGACKRTRKEKARQRQPCINHCGRTTRGTTSINPYRKPGECWLCFRKRRYKDDPEFALYMRGKNKNWLNKIKQDPKRAEIWKEQEYARHKRYRARVKESNGREEV